MVEATFRKKSNLHLFTLLFGAGIIIPSIAARISGAEAENGLSLFIYVGLAFLILSLILSQFNRKAYLKICDGRIEGRFHYFGRINIPVSDIRFSYAQLNRLTLLLKTAKESQLWEFQIHHSSAMPSCKVSVISRTSRPKSVKIG